MSDKLRVNPDDLIFGNGSNEIIELAVRTFAGPGDEAIMAHPSFVVYSTIVQAAGGRNVIVPLKDRRHDLDAMASKITDRTKIIFIANPNNPTGTINTKAGFDSFMEKVPDSVLVVVDEAYYEYVMSPDYADSMKYFRQDKDILILRTFSKVYGLAALRIGYGIARPEINTEMNKVRQPFNINSLAQKAAIAALADKKHLEKTIRINERGKKYLYKELSRLEVNYVPTEANFIYIFFKNEIAAELYNALLKEGVIVRPMGHSEIRATIGLPKENKKFIDTLRKIIKQ